MFSKKLRSRDSFCL